MSLKSRVLYWITGECLLDLFFGWAKSQKKKMGIEK